MPTYHRGCQARTAKGQGSQEGRQHSRPSSKHQLPCSLRVIGDTAQHSSRWGHVANHVAGQTFRRCLKAGTCVSVLARVHRNWSISIVVLDTGDEDLPYGGQGTAP